MRGWAICSLLALAGCDDAGFGLLRDGGLDVGFPDRPFIPPPDMDPTDGPDMGDGPPDDGGMCPEGTVRHEDRCIGGCELVEVLGCTDGDGDCYPVDCPGAPVQDCDDARPGSRPGAAEVCDGLDNDCDGEPDEDFEIGDDCDGCGGAGKTECSVHDLAAVACSTDLAQSSGPARLDEVCNGEDDDCDGETDEFCRFDLPEAERAFPLVCGERALWVEAGALVEPAETIVPAPVAYPACAGDVVAWLDPGDGCEGDVLACTRGHLWLHDGDAARDVTGLAVVGPPLLAGDHVYWHAVVGDVPVLSRQPVAGGGVETLFEGVAASDPTAPVEGRMVARFWTGGAAEVAVRELETLQGSDLLGPGSAPGVPVANAAWVVWPAGEASSLWVVERANPRNGFQLTMRDGPQRAPKLDGDRLVWLDESTAPATLRSFDLLTGLAEEVARGDIGADDFAVGPGMVLWIDGLDMYRHRWAP